jgi:hypothetical protein
MSSIYVGSNDELRCPMPGCTAELYVTHLTCTPVFITPPWPGASDTSPVSAHWQVECTEGHTVFTWVDQARAMNAADPEESIDETADYAEPFDVDLLIAHLNDLTGVLP